MVTEPGLPWSVPWPIPGAPAACWGEGYARSRGAEVCAWGNVRGWARGSSSVCRKVCGGWPWAVWVQGGLHMGLRLLGVCTGAHGVTGVGGCVRAQGVCAHGCLHGQLCGWLCALAGCCPLPTSPPGPPSVLPLSFSGGSDPGRRVCQPERALSRG